MVRLLLLGGLIALLFWLLPAGPAAVWSIIPALLLLGVLYDAVRRGRTLLKRREDGAMDEISMLSGHFLIFHAVWLGLHAPASDSVSGVEGIGGGLETSGFDSGFDGGFNGGAGGDGGF